MIMLTVLLVAVTVTAATRLSLTTQYYNLLAKNAGDAGYVYAKACLKANGGIATWSDAKPLTPYTDCSGTTLSSLSCTDSSTDQDCSVSVNGPNMKVLVIGGGGGGGPAHRDQVPGEGHDPGRGGLRPLRPPDLRDLHRGVGAPAAEWRAGLTGYRPARP